MKVTDLTAVSLFSGAGGFCEGMHSAGFEILCAVENDQFAAETYRFNFPEVPLIEGSVEDFLYPDPRLHLEQFGLHNIDVVFGGPPCQGYSQIGTRALNDERNFLFREYARVVATLHPRIFVMENVPNLVMLRGGYFAELILEEFAAIGYSNVAIIRAVATDYGVPQERNRVFFIGVSDEYKAPSNLEQFLWQTLDAEKVSKVVTVWDAIGDLPEDVVPSGETLTYPETPENPTVFQRQMRLDFGWSPYPKVEKAKRGIACFNEIALHNHHTKEIREKRLNLIRQLEPGKKGDSLPISVWNGKRPEKWRRLHPDKPAYTLLANMHRDLSEFVHPSLDRWITVREAARLQSFHDGFVFVTSEWQQLKQIGNAVPPLLGRAIGKAATALYSECSKTNVGASRVRKRRRLYSEQLGLFEPA